MKNQKEKEIEAAQYKLAPMLVVKDYLQYQLNHLNKDIEKAQKELDVLQSVEEVQSR